MVSLGSVTRLRYGPLCRSLAQGLPILPQRRAVACIFGPSILTFPRDGPSFRGSDLGAKKRHRFWYTFGRYEELKLSQEIRVVSDRFSACLFVLMLVSILERSAAMR